MIQVYGIKNCDTVKKALSSLNSHHIKYEFIDLKHHIPDTHMLYHWCASVGVDSLINTRGTTWRQLSDVDKQSAKQNPIPYIQQNISLMKRPIIIHTDGEVTVGFTAIVQNKLYTQKI